MWVAWASRPLKAQLSRCEVKNKHNHTWGARSRPPKGTSGWLKSERFWSNEWRIQPLSSLPCKSKPLTTEHNLVLARAPAFAEESCVHSKCSLRLEICLALFSIRWTTCSHKSLVNTHPSFPSSAPKQCMLCSPCGGPNLGLTAC